MGTILRATFRRALRLENRRATPRSGRIEREPAFRSAILGNERAVTVYLPPGYDDRPERRYPVLYLQDGQNLFDPGRAFVPGQHWRLREAADDAIGERTASPMILVGVDNAGADRIAEYTPAPDPKHPEGGRAEEYGRMLAEELRLWVDARFRTLPGREHTAIGGSSLGGLVALHLALTRPGEYGRAVAMSPSVWWNGRSILAAARNFTGTPPRLWLDVGGREGAEALRDVRALRDVLLATGWGGDAFRFHEDRRGDHSERAWARRARMALEFLFPPG